jgi:hypothetical protein
MLFVMSIAEADPFAGRDTAKNEYLHPAAYVPDIVGYGW